MQTLHPKHFDQGTILAQTPYPGFLHGCKTVPDLLALMSSKGAEMLVQSINSRLYLNPVNSPNVLQDNRKAKRARAAPKITSQDRFIDWDKWTAKEIIRRHLAIGPLWSFVKNRGKVRRLIWSTGFKYKSKTKVPYIRDCHVGRLMVFGDEECAGKQVAYVRTIDNRYLGVGRIKIEGDVENPPLRAAKKADMIDRGQYRQNDAIAEIVLARDPLAGDSCSEKAVANVP